ncbi:MAG TPA: hypothetical protein VF600_12470 [Abditibacteriaceae bacterium]
MPILRSDVNASHNASEIRAVFGRFPRGDFNRRDNLNRTPGPIGLSFQQHHIAS